MSRFISPHLKRKLKSSRFWGRNGVIVAFLVLMTLLIPRTFRLGYQYEIGKPWQEEALTAPFDFPIYKTEDSLTIEKQKIGDQVKDIYRLDTSHVSQVRIRISQRARQYERLSKAFLEASISIDSSQRARVRTQIKEAFPAFKGTPPKAVYAASVLEESADKWLERIHQKGFLHLNSTRLDTSLGGAPIIALRVEPGKEKLVDARGLLSSREELNKWLAREMPGGDLSRVVRMILQQEIAPNYVYDAGLTEEARKDRQKLISRIHSKIQKGDLIISKDEIVSREAYLQLVSLEKEQQERFGSQDRSWVFVGQFLTVTFITFILLVNLSVTRPRIYFSLTKLSLILFTILLAFASMAVATRLTDVAVKLVDILGPNINLSYIYLAPACIVPIFISSFFEHRLGFLCNLLVALFGAVLIQQGLEFAFVQTMAGTVAVYNLRRLRKRERFFFTLAYIFFAYSISYIVYNLLSKGNLEAISYHTLLLFGINVAITMIAYNLIYLLERVFGETSDLTYLELLDTNHPLLQELARKAPGTFQHSLQVANIAEATINEIGGNALLVHVGAMYHDIGKIPQANYFIENLGEADKKYNPHKELDCLQSAEIIIGHVKHGVELAHKHHLPREIVNFIETHHGTTRVEYFYRIYLKSKECIDNEADNLFRYPGPLPFSKETAVLMISDSIEAASRAMKAPTAEKLKELVDGIIDHKIKDGQLENSNLTFKDIASVRRVLKKQLLSIYHGRIEYPEEKKELVG